MTVNLPGILACSFFFPYCTGDQGCMPPHLPELLMTATLPGNMALQSSVAPLNSLGTRPAYRAVTCLSLSITTASTPASRRACQLIHLQACHVSMVGGRGPRLDAGAGTPWAEIKVEYGTYG